MTSQAFSTCSRMILINLKHQRKLQGNFIIFFEAKPSIDSWIFHNPAYQAMHRRSWSIFSRWSRQFRSVQAQQEKRQQGKRTVAWNICQASDNIECYFSSSSTRNSPDSLSSAGSNEYIVPSFNFSGLIDNFAQTESANIKELVEKASTKHQWDWKKFAEELLSKSLSEKDLDTYINIGMLIAKDAPNFKKVLGNVALSALANELGKEIGLAFAVENESDDTATWTANFISLLYDNGCLTDSHMYQCMNHIATGSFGSLRRVKIFIALLRPATAKIKKNLMKEVLIDYLKTVRLSSIEPMKSTHRWIYTELIDLLKSLTATTEDGTGFLDKASARDRSSMNERPLIQMRDNAAPQPPMLYPGPVRYLNPSPDRPQQQLFDYPRVFPTYPVNNMMRIPFNAGPPYMPNFMFDRSNDYR